MLRQIIAITLKELKVVWLDREALALLFAMPMFFILVMSMALQGVFEAGTKGRPVEVLVVRSQIPEQHWPLSVQPSPSGRQLPNPHVLLVGSQKPLQH